MTRNFEPIADATLSPEDVQVSQHVSVGWGKAETQFKGKRARAMRDPTIPETVDEGSLSAFDDRKVHITWRGDGAYIAISTVEEETRRLIRVYTREGVLDSVSEPVNGLEGCLGWKPSGSLIAGIQRLPERVDVIFFERNGLRHGEFSLSTSTDITPPCTIRGLAWNGDSSILAICLQDRIQLWTTGNYHWYLKQELVLPDNSSSSDGPYILQWHPESPTKLCYAVNCRQIESFFPPKILKR
jgi:elongator complex protein 1